MELDTDGNNNTLKTAQLQIKVFSLKQLEMFELFFLRPAIKVVIEWGVNADIRNKTNKYIIDSKLFAKKNFTNYITQYLKIFSHKENAYREAKLEYLKTLKETNYDYDYMAGNVTNYTFTPEEDGSYNIMLEVSAGNELQMWMPVKQANTTAKASKTSDNTQVKEFQSWVNQIAIDINVPSLATLINEKEDGKEFFNWTAINDKQEDSKFSKDPYISFRLILKILNNMVVYKESEKHLTVDYKLDGNDIIPVNSSPYIISTTSDFIIPGQLPSIKVVTDKDSKEKIIIKEGESIDLPINGYSFNISNERTATQKTLISRTDSKESVASTTGNLLNMFVRWPTFVGMYKDAYVQADIINSLLGMFNQNMFGLCALELGKPDDIPSASTPLTIIDTKLQTIVSSLPSVEERYRFKIGPMGSILKEFTFTMELGALAQAQALYSSQLAINDIQNDTTQSTETVVDKAYKNANNFKTPNADGYYSINAIEIKLVEESQEWNNTLVSASLSAGDITDVNDGEKEKQNMNEVLSQNFIKFRTGNNSTTSGNNLIYTDTSLIQSKIPISSKGTTALTELEITLAIDGIAGLSAGEYFHIDGVPEIYNRNGYFQIMNVKHGLDDSGWKTTIVASYRIEIKE
jgi:hypothetical protein